MTRIPVTPWRTRDLLASSRRLAAAGVLAALASLSGLGDSLLSAADESPTAPPRALPVLMHSIEAAKPIAADKNTVVAPGGLRWKSPNRAAQEAVATGRAAGRAVNEQQVFGDAEAADDVFAAQPVRQVGWAQRTIGDAPEPAESQPVVNLQAIKPIPDPYTPRVAQAPAPMAPRPVPAPVAPLEPPLVAPKALDPLDPPAPVDPAPPVRQPSRLAPPDLDPLPAPVPMPAPRGAEDVQPMPMRAAPLAPMRPNADCDKIYNGRNFCDEDGECKAAIRALAKKPLSAISLDTTPPYAPTGAGLTDEAAAAQMKDRLAMSESRTWVDRQGRTVATGRLVDFVRGEAVIAQDNGQTTSVVARNLDNDSHAYLSAWWGLPHDCRLSDEQYREIAINDYRMWEHPLTFTWHASALCHKPLYFEEMCLERYGHTTGPYSQPFVSAAHFFGGVALLPYKMGMDPYHECQYALGYYRPGSCAPWYIPATPISGRGAAAEALFVTGVAFVIP